MMQITELEVWKAAIELAKNCFDLSKKFPNSDHCNLGCEIRNITVKIPANISAAASRKQGKESLRHLFRARDMLFELESHLQFAQAMGFISTEELNHAVDLLGTSKRLLFGFIKYYKRANQSNSRRRGNRYHRQEQQPHIDDSDDSFDIDDIEDIDIEDDDDY